MALISACGGGDGDGGKTAGTPDGSTDVTTTDVNINDRQNRYDYNLQGQRCETGYQKFRNLRELCRGLRDDAKNRYCARKTRYEYFKEYCRGMEWNPRDDRRGGRNDRRR